MEELKGIPVIKLIEKGPLRISGNFSLVNSEDEPIKIVGNAFLCRCGNSKRLPFCDGSHNESCE